MLAAQQPKPAPEPRNPRSAYIPRPDFLDPPKVDRTFAPTKEQRATVTQMAGLGFAHEDIRLMVVNPRTQRCVAVSTLRQHFQRELASGKTIALRAVAAALFKSAIGGNVTAQIFMLKTQGRWKEERDPIPGEATPVKIVFREIDGRVRSEEDAPNGDDKRAANGDDLGGEAA